MSIIKQSSLPLIAVALIAGIVGYIVRGGDSRLELTATAVAALQNERGVTEGRSQVEQKAAVGSVNPRDMYFPGTEELKPNEMRIVACGTGMPAQRRSQAATCWLVELGNGDKFIFDIGTGSSAPAHRQTWEA